MRTTVFHVIPTLVRGGAEKQMALLAKNLDPDRYEVHVVVLTHSGPLESELREAGIPLHFIEKRGKLDLRALSRLARLLRRYDPEIVHTWLFAANAYGRLAARMARVPVVIAAERCVDPWKRGWHHFIDRQLAKRTQQFVTNTSAVVEFYSHHGISSDRFEVIPNGIEAVAGGPAETADGNLQCTKDEFFRRLKITPRKCIVGAVGRLWAQKGYEDLIWAAELLRVAHRDVWFVIFGDGPDRKKLQHFRDQSEAHQAVRFVGHRDDAAYLMSAFDVLWNGSLYEGQSNTIMEAMTQGIPVVATDIPGNRDLVVNGETGYLFPLGDVEALARRTLGLLEDDALRTRMSQQSRARMASEFGVKPMVDRYDELYTTLVSAHCK